MSSKFKTIEIHSDLKGAFVDFAIEAHKKYPALPDVRKAVLTQVGNVITVTFPIDERRSERPGNITTDCFCEIAEDMFMMEPTESVDDLVAWVA